MFLKALTLRGFKSFADKTVLEFEPGVTVVVGPNGSGKSNLVDAVAWVLGAQGPRTVRGGKMDDVVFAGTPQRAALGRAEVSLTIDNSAGLLPIEFTEVTITRTLFRAGDSEYRINDAPCRLLDIQELLSDTGIGRQQHVIVGQGQIDTVLNARPEDRRAIIEEAAGILKYRKRRERAERRLESTEGSLLRLNDLLREVRRQLTPLQKQADAARRHDGVVEELRALRLHLAGHEIAGLQTRLERLRDRGHDLTRDEAAVQARLRDLDVAVLDAESALTIAGHGDLADALARIESLHARARGFGALLDEKSRGLSRELAAVADEGVFETLVADAANVREQLEQLDGEAARLVEARGAVEQAERELASALAALTPVEIGDESGDSEHASDNDVRAVRRELESRRTALARIDAELERVAARLATSSERGVAAESARNALTESRTQHSASLATSRATRASADAAANAAESAASQADEASRSAHRDAARWHARAEALDQALGEARSGSGIDAVDGLPGVVGPLVDHLEIDDGAGAAVAAVLGDALGAVVVDSRPAARAVVARVAEGDLRALLVVAGTAGGSVAARALPPGAVALASKVHSRVPGLEATLARMLDGAVLVEQGWSAALDVALDHPELTVVTGSGDRFGGNA
ncbi:MAG: AAA family ATPase, partial [Acidimicrobiia bacterium]